MRFAGRPWRCSSFCRSVDSAVVRALALAFPSVIPPGNLLLYVPLPLLFLLSFPGDLLLYVPLP